MFAVSYISSKPKKNTWSGVFGYQPDTKGELESKGQMLMTMALTADLQFDFENLGNLLFDEVQQSYFFANKFTGVLEQLEIAIEMLGRRIDQILEREPELVKSGLDLQLAINIIKGNVCYSAVIGESKIKLIRDTEIVNIDEHLSDPTGRSIMRYGSFEIDPEQDTLFMLTDIADKLISTETILNVESKLNLKQLASYQDDLFTVAMMAGEDRIKEVEEKGVEAMKKKKEKENEKLSIPISKKDEVEDEDNKSLEIEELEDKNVSSIDSNNESIEVEEEEPTDEYVELENDDHVDEDKYEKSQVAEILNNLKTRFLGLVTLIKTKSISVYSNVRSSDRLDKLKEHTSKVSSKLSDPDTRNAKTYQVLIAKLVRRLKNLQTTIMRFVRKNVMGIDQSKPMYLKGRSAQSKNWRIIAVVVIVLAFLLYTFVSSAIESSRQQSLQDETQRAISEQVQISESISSEISSLTVGLGNETEKLNKINQINGVISDIRQISLEELTDKKDFESQKQNIIQDLEIQINELRGITEVSPRLIADLGINFQSVLLTDISYHDGGIYVSDSNNDVIYKIEATAGATPISFADENLNSPTAIDIDDNGDLIVIDEDPDSSIATVSLSDASVLKHLGGLNPQTLGIPDNIKNVRIGSEDRVYWIDERTQEVKYVRRSPVGGYGTAPVVRFSNDNFGNVLDIDIADGKIYVLTPNRGILRFWGTDIDNYTLTGLLPDDGLSNTSAFEVTDQNIYVADSRKNRIVVLSKARNGTDPNFMDFQRQYVASSQEFSDIVDIVFDESKNVLYVLSGVRVYEINAYDN